MARAAFIMDRIMHRIGLHGKSFIPMLIGFGCTVRVRDLDFGDEEEFVLVGAGEEDYDTGKILFTSPLAQGLLTGKFASADEVPEGRARTRHFSGDRPQTCHGQPGCEQEDGYQQRTESRTQIAHDHHPAPVPPVDDGAGHWAQDDHGGDEKEPDHGQRGGFAGLLKGPNGEAKVSHGRAQQRDYLASPDYPEGAHASRSFLLAHRSSLSSPCVSSALF